MESFQNSSILKQQLILCTEYCNIISQGNDPFITVRLWNARENVRSVLRNTCTSFSAMDDNAQFSEMFELKRFGEINDNEKTLFISQYVFKSNCL